MLACNKEMAVDLVAEAHHRVANSLTLLVSLVRMQALSVGKSTTPLSGPEVRLLLEGVAARISTVSQLHRLLAHIPEGEDEVDFGPHLKQVCQNLVEIVSSPQRPIHLAQTLGDCPIAAHQVQPLTMMLCEIVINALKYAHPADLPVNLTLGCCCDDKGALVLEAGDDGVGLPENFNIASDGGLGFKVIRSLASQIGAQLQIDSNDLGLRFRIRLPR